MIIELFSEAKRTKNYDCRHNFRNFEDVNTLEYKNKVIKVLSLTLSQVLNNITYISLDFLYKVCLTITKLSL